MHTPELATESPMSRWRPAMTLDAQRLVIEGSETALLEAIGSGADLRIYTEFRHEEHIEPGSDRQDLVREAADFRVTYLLDDRWCAGIISLRQPVDIPFGFGPRPSMSFFLYNQNGQQALARMHLDEKPASGQPGPSTPKSPMNMPKYHTHEAWDELTNAPSQNFDYDFDIYRFCVHNVWRQVYAHDEKGLPTEGSLDNLVEAFAQGAEVKIGIRNLCNDLGQTPMDHEVFVHLGSCYYYTDSKLFLGCSHPVVRVAPAIPMRYQSSAWDCGWLMPRTDGFVAKLLYSPYTLQSEKSEGHYAMRWFVNGQ